MKTNVTTIDTKFAGLTNDKAKITLAINTGLFETVSSLLIDIEAHYTQSGNYKKAKKETKETILESLYITKVNPKTGRETQVLQCDKNTLRAFNVAFNIIFRDIKDLAVNEFLTFAQIENASLYFTKAEIEALNECEYADECLELFKDTAKNYKKVSKVSTWDSQHKKAGK